VFQRGGRLSVDDLPNLRTAVSRLLDAGDAEAAVMLAITARRVWFDAGALTEMRDLYARLVDLPVHHLTRARTAILAGSLAYLIGGLRDTQQLESAIATLRAADDFDPIAINAFCYLGAMAMDRGELVNADRWASQALEWARRSADIDGESMALDFSAYLARNRGDFERAADLMSRAVEIARGHAAPADLAQRLASLSLAMSSTDANAAAERTALEALQLARAARARPSERDALMALGEVLGRADPRDAIVHLGRAVVMSHELGQEGIEELTRFAKALMLSGDTERAALITGAASARQVAAAIDDPECAKIRADLEARLDRAALAKGALLEPQAVLDVVADALSNA
jgi:tetratricopeptide (TPR) repeat protein